MAFPQIKIDVKSQQPPQKSVVCVLEEAKTFRFLFSPLLNTSNRPGRSDERKKVRQSSEEQRLLEESPLATLIM